MKKILIILVFVIIGLVIPIKSFAWFDKWTLQDSILQGSVLTFTTLDLCQTYSFLYKNDNLTGGESNPFMGQFPSKKRFFTIGGGWILLHTGISYLLPKNYRTIWQISFISVESYALYHNYSCGVRIKF